MIESIIKQGYNQIQLCRVAKTFNSTRFNLGCLSTNVRGKNTKSRITNLVFQCVKAIRMFRIRISGQSRFLR